MVLQKLRGLSWLRLDVVLIFLITAAVRFWELPHPNAVVFDEFHFGRFINQYSAHTYFFDIHPPFAKLTLYIIGSALGYDATKCSYNNIGQVYGPDCNVIVLRAISAFFGALLPPLTYLIAKELGAARSGRILAAAFVIFDGLNHVESRLLLTDSQLMFYSALALFVALKYWNRVEGWGPGGALQLEEAADGNREKVKVAQAYPSLQMEKFITADRLRWSILLGVACAAAVSVKFTALATPGLIALECFFAFCFIRRPVPFIDLIVMAVSAFLFYVANYVIHFTILTKSGDGDAFMLSDFQATLPGNSHYDPDAQFNFWRTFFYLNREMVDASARITTRHNWESTWKQWITNARGVLYWSESKKGLTSQVYLLGNPIAVWGAGIGVLLFVLIMLVMCRLRPTNLDDKIRPSRAAERDSRYVYAGLYCFIGYWLNLIPYILVNRPSFVYHYMPGLFYAEVLMALVATMLPKWPRRVFAAATIIALAAGFYYYAPWFYGLPLTREGMNARRWLSTWT